MKNSYAGRGLCASIAALAMLAACSSPSGEGQDPASASSSAAPGEASPAPFASSPSGDATGIKPAEAGDVQLVSGRFGIYAGTQWAGFRAPRGYAIGYEGDADHVLVYSPVDTRTNIVFHHLEDRETLFTGEELKAQLEDDGITDAQIRSDVTKIGDFNAVAVYVPDHDGYKALVAAVDIGGQIWVITINAPSESEISELFESVSKLEYLEASPLEISNKPKTISADVDGRSFEAKVAGASVTFEMPDGYEEIEDAEPGTVGFAEGEASVSLRLDTFGYTIDLDDAVRQVRGRNPGLAEGDVRPIDGITEVAGHRAVAVDVTRSDGRRTRIYLFDMSSAVVELSVEAPEGSEEFDELVKAVQNATS